MSEVYLAAVNHNPELTEAFRRVHFLDHAFPVHEIADLSRVQSFELSVIASGIDSAKITDSRVEGLMQSVDDYNDYLDGGVQALAFDESFISHITERIHQARLMDAFLK